MKRSKYFYLGASLIVSAAVLLFIFVVTCIKKRNFLMAIAAVLAADVGAVLLIKHRLSRNGGHILDIFDEYATGDDRIVKAKRIRENKKPTHCRRVVCEFDIPIDDETTEEDFING